MTDFEWWPQEPKKEANAELVLRRASIRPTLQAQADDDSVSNNWPVTGQAELVGLRHHWATTNLGRSANRCQLALWRDLMARRAAAVAALPGLIREVSIELETPLVIGFGGAGAASDTSLLVHPTHGYPFLPGSSLKGVAKATATELGMPLHLYGEPADEPPATPESTAEFETEPDNGNPRRRSVGQGTFVFFDAIPSGEIKVDRAVMTPHAADYYNQSGAPPAQVWPADYLQPTPIEFLAVTKGQFVTHLYSPTGNASHISQAAEALSCGAYTVGFGARTAAGFGYAKVSTVPPSDNSVPHRPTRNGTQP